MSRKHKRYGWIPSLPHKVKKYSSCNAFSDDLPSLVDLRPKCPAVYNQEELGSCTANGIAGAIQFLQPALMPSRLFIYYNERVMEGSVEQDSGAQIHDGIQSIHLQGVCPESDWPYNINKFTQEPSDICYSEALKDCINDYSSIDTITEMKQCLHSGFPVVFGMTVFESFESQDVATLGLVPMPADGEEVLGGHCMLIVGYDNDKQCFIVRNSWGDGWGLLGYCMIPYKYIEQYASDFWSIK